MEKNGDASRAWEQVKDTLRGEVSRVSFETWLADTQGICLDDKALIVEVGNGYGREWLMEHVRTRAVQITREILGCERAVQFVVSGEEAGDAPQDSREGHLHLETRYLSHYEEIIKPERVIAFPSYYLRWIPWLGVDLAWLPIGFRQAAYIYGCRHEEGDVFEASAHNIAHWSGMSIRTFWRRVNDPYLRWFVRKAEDENSQNMFRWNEKEGKFEKRSNRWQVVMSMPLTPADQSSLRNWITERKESGLDSISTLKAAIETPIDELLPWPDEILPPEEVEEPLSPGDIVMEVFGKDIDSELQSTFYQLTDELTNHIKGRNLLVSHYFIENWLPLLRSGPGWLVTLLRSRCYYNQKTEELRDDIWVAGGYGELSSRLGLRRPKTVNEWLTGSGRVSQSLKGFFKRVERVKRSDQAVALRLKVRMREPFTPEDHKVYENRILRGGQGAIDTMEKGGQGANGTMGKGGQGANDTMGKGGQGANGTMGKGGSGREWHGLKDSLIKVPLNLKYLKDLKTTTSAEVKVSDNDNEEVVVLFWNLPKLISHNRVDLKLKSELIDGGATAEIFVSWLIYAASPKGSGIGDPVGHAVSRIRHDPLTGAGKDYERLAYLPPQELADLIYRKLQGTEKWAGCKDWSRVMRDADLDRVETLAGQLGVVVEGGDNP